MTPEEADDLDAGWEDDPEPESDEDEDLDALDAGWGSAKERMSALEARRMKQRAREAKRRARAEATQQKQRRKKKRGRPSASMEEPGAHEGAREESFGGAGRRRTPDAPGPKPAASRKTQDPRKTLVIIALVIATGAGLAWLMSHR